MGITITRVKYPEKESILEIDFAEPKEGFTTPPEMDGKYKNPNASPDLRSALNRLRVHFGIICGWLVFSDEIKAQLDFLDKVPEVLLEEFKVSGFNYKVDEESGNGIMITGYHNHMGKAINVNSPFWKLKEQGADAYVHAKHLNGVITHINQELHKYMFEGKRAPKPAEQGKMDFDKVTHMQVAPPAAKVFDKLVEGSDGQGLVVEHVTHEQATGGRRRGRPPGSTKKVPQSAETPSGEIKDAEFEEREETGGEAGEGENVIE